MPNLFPAKNVVLTKNKFGNKTVSSVNIIENEAPPIEA